MGSAAPAKCPKCGTPRLEEPACPRCGLRADRMEAYATEREQAVPEAVRAAWTAVEATWDDAAVHDALFTATTTHRTYAWTAARYRERRDATGDETLDRHLQRIQRAAEVTLLVSATARSAGGRKPYRSSIAVLVVLALMIFIGLMFATYLQARSRVRGHDRDALPRGKATIGRPPGPGMAPGKRPAPRPATPQVR